MTKEFSKWYCEKCGAKFDYNPIPRIAISSYFYYCPVCGEMTEYVYIDEIGGTHSGGLGWDPDGEYCGECCKYSCAECHVWKRRNS